MKNIHVLPTDKPSRLYFWENKLRIGDFITAPKNLGISNQNIYITNNEEIEKGSIVLSTFDNWKGTSSSKPVVGKIIKIEKDAYLIKYYSEHFGEIQSLWDKGHSKKIILTTDQDLIADGVQPIDDEFLEWFVNNPSCEFVEVEPLIAGFIDGEVSYYEGMYKIITTKEQQKQHLIDIMRSDEELGLYDEQETLEEVAETQLYITINKIIDGGKNLPKGYSVTRCQAVDYAFKIALEVAKWQQQQNKNLYSEEDMIKASEYGYNFHKTTQFPEQNFEDSCIRNTKQWLTTFKKK